MTNLFWSHKLFVTAYKSFSDVHTNNVKVKKVIVRARKIILSITLCYCEATIQCVGKVILSSQKLLESKDAIVKAIQLLRESQCHGEENAKSLQGYKHQCCHCEGIKVTMRITERPCEGHIE